MGLISYIPGNDLPGSFPLSRFLPPVPAGMGAAFLSRYVPECTWVLDPFGVAPLLDVELVHAGCNVLVAVNNPITRVLLELAAAPPSTEDLQAALSELASARRGDERLETHLKSLYQTECSTCHRLLQAEAYVWEKGAQIPFARIYHCPCGDGGEFPVTEDDLRIHARITATEALHRARALERVTRLDDPNRSNAEEALSCYQPRAIYAVVTTINKLDAILPTLPRELRRALLGLLLVAFDETNSLWSHPADRPRPKQLTIPTKFLEKNLWLALEQAVSRWERTTPVGCAEWKPTDTQPPQAPRDLEEGNIYIFEGPARGLTPALKIMPPGAVITALPRPNQAYWTLSALWTGWLWGQSAASSFKSVLHRRRYDWTWHTDALLAALKSVAPHLPLNTPVFAILTEPEPAFLTASLVAAYGAGFVLDGIALRGRSDPVLLRWRRQAFLRAEAPGEEPDSQLLKEALQRWLASRGEPAPYLHLHAAGLCFLEEEHALRRTNETAAWHQTQILAALEDPTFHHFSDSPNKETGLWSLAKWEQNDSLSDRIEILLVRHIQKNPGTSFIDLELVINNSFPGLMTPGQNLIQSVLDSYAEEKDTLWTLRQEDAPAFRMREMEASTRLLQDLGTRLGYDTNKEETGRLLQWMEAGQVAYSFHILASAVISRLFHSTNKFSGQSILVLPAERISLLTYKLTNDPSLQVEAETWKVLSFDTLGSLERLDNLTREGWLEELASRRLKAHEQLKLF